MTGGTMLEEPTNGERRALSALTDELCVTQRRTPADIVAEALERYKPIAIYAGFSGDASSGERRAALEWVLGVTEN